MSLTQVTAAAHGDEAWLQIAAGALGGLEFLVGVDTMHGHVVLAHDGCGHGLGGSELDVGGQLVVEITQEHDADVVLVLVGNVGTLILDRAAFPDSAGPVDDVVIADIAPAAFFHMETLNVLEAGHGGGHIGEIDDFPAFVVQGDTVDAVHGIDFGGIGCQFGPGITWDDVGGTIAWEGRLWRGSRIGRLGWQIGWGRGGWVGVGLVGRGIVLARLGHLRWPGWAWALLEHQGGIAASSGDCTK